MFLPYCQGGLLIRNSTQVFIAVALLFCMPGAGRSQTPPIPLDTLLIQAGARTSAMLPLTTRAVEVIDVTDIAASPARNLSDLLSWALGLEAVNRSPTNAKLRLRGSTPEQVLVLVDGMRIGDGGLGTQGVDLSISLHDVERVEILRGASPAAYGTDAVGGVVNVITRRDRSVVFGRLEGGSFNSRLGVFGGRFSNGGRDLYLSGEHERSAGHRPGTDNESLQARIGMRVPSGEREFNTSINVSSRAFGAAGFHAPHPPYDAFHEVTNASATLAWEAPPGRRFSIVPRVRVQLEEDDFLLMRDDPDYFHTHHSSQRVSGELVTRFALSERVRLAGGTEIWLERLQGTNPGLPGFHCSPSSPCDLEEHRLALFTEVSAGTIGMTTTTFGLRTDWHSEYGIFIAPSLAGAIWPSDGMRLHGTTGRVQRVPTWSERYYQDSLYVGNPDLEPERAWTAEVGATISAVDWLRIAFAGFARRVDTLIDWTKPVEEPDAAWRTINYTDAIFDGIEFEMTMLDVLDSQISIRASGVTHSAEDRDDYISRYAFRPLTRIVSVGVDRRLPRNARLSTRLLHGRRQGEDGFVRLDTRFSFLWRDRVRFYVDALNITSEEYLNIAGAPEPGFGLFVGGSWAWTP